MQHPRFKNESVTHLRLPPDRRLDQSNHSWLCGGIRQGYFVCTLQAYQDTQL